MNQSVENHADLKEIIAFEKSEFWLEQLTNNSPIPSASIRAVHRWGWTSLPTAQTTDRRTLCELLCRTWADRAGVRKVYPSLPNDSAFTISTTSERTSRPHIILDRISAHSSDTTFALSSAVINAYAYKITRLRPRNIEIT